MAAAVASMAAQEVAMAVMVAEVMAGMGAAVVVLKVVERVSRCLH